MRGTNVGTTRLAYKLVNQLHRLRFDMRVLQLLWRLSCQQF